MPIARVVARRFEDALEFAENLRSWFSVIEIAAPEHHSSSAVALEICLDESSPREALGRVLEYVADHPFVAESAERVVAEPAQDAALLPAPATQPLPEAATQARMVSVIGAVTPISPATIETTAAAAAPMTAASAPAPGETLSSWRKSLRAFFRVRSTHAAASSVVLQTSDASSQTAAHRASEKNWRQQREAQFWVPPAYKEPAWSEEDRRHREQLERNRLAEVELQRQRVVEARRERDRQLALQLAAERERLEREEQQRRAARQEQLRMPPASVPVPTAAATRQPALFTLTPRLRRHEARLWKQALVLATAAAMLIAVAIAEYANRVPGGATEVEREPAQVLPMKPAADEGAPRPSPVLLTSAENEPNHGERVNSPVATWHRHTGRDEIDYVARDVTIRYFEHGQRMNDTTRGRSTNAVVKQVAPPAARHATAGIKQISDLDQN